MLAARTYKQKDSQNAYMEKLQEIKVRVPKEYYDKIQSLIEWKVDLSPELTYESRLKE